MKLGLGIVHENSDVAYEVGIANFGPIQSNLQAYAWVVTKNMLAIYWKLLHN